MYKKLGTVIFGAALVTGLLVAVSRARGAEDIKAQIEAANRVFMGAFAKSDAAGVAACYTADAQLMPTGVDIITGQAAIEAYWKQGMAAAPAKVTLTTVEAEQHGDTAIEVGRARVENDKGLVVDEAKYIVIWKRVDGKWKLHRDIFNSNRGPI